MVQGNKKVRKAVLPVAGVGTRMLPLTKSVPKEMFPIDGKPIIQHLVEEAVSAGVEEIIIVYSKGKEAIKHYFEKDNELEVLLLKRDKQIELKTVRDLHQMAQFSFVLQDQPLGDGHAILCARELVGDEPCLVLFGDELYIGQQTASQQLVDVYNDQKTSVIAMQEVEGDEVSKYGVIDGEIIAEDFYNIRNMVEKPSPEEAPSKMIIVGKYVITPKVFEYLEKHPSGSGEIRLIDALRGVLKEEEIYGFRPDGDRYDTGTLDGYNEACLAFLSQYRKYRYTMAEHSPIM